MSREIKSSTKYRPYISKNEPCKSCGKPTRSHWSSRTGTAQCHECWLKDNADTGDEK